MTTLADIIADEELGGTHFSVIRAVYRLSEGEKELDRQDQYEAFGTLHPAKMEDLQLLPEEYRSEKIIVIHSPISLTTGRRLDDKTFIAPDRIQYQLQTYLVISIRDWSAFGFCKAYAVLKKGEESL